MNEFSLLHTLILFGVGVLAGGLNVFAGGGSSLSLPALIFLGLDAGLANGTNRIAIFIQNIFAVQSFHKQEVSEFNKSFKLALWTLPGGVLGALTAIRISNELFETILAIVLIGVIISMIVPSKRSGEEKTDPEQSSSPWLYVSLLGIGFYGGFIQVGVGFLLMAALFHLLGAGLVRVNMHKVFIVLIYTIPALAIFVFSGNVNWPLGLSLAAGNSLGAWWAARLSVKKGDRFIRYALMAAMVIIALKLLDVF